MTIGRQLALYEVPVQISSNAVLAALHQLLFVNIACMPTGNLVLITGLAEETVPYPITDRVRTSRIHVSQLFIAISHRHTMLRGLPRFNHDLSGLCGLPRPQLCLFSNCHASLGVCHGIRAGLV